jgi:hypothetical protein
VFKARRDGTISRTEYPGGKITILEGWDAP